MTSPEARGWANVDRIEAERAAKPPITSKHLNENLNSIFFEMKHLIDRVTPDPEGQYQPWRSTATHTLRVSMNVLSLYMNHEGAQPHD